MYSIEGLKHGIERCKVNISSLEKAIADEQKTIADYKIMISNLERAQKKKEEAEANCHVEVVCDDDTR